jgi:hypothetical protein
MKFRTPSPAAIRAFARQNKITGAQAAELAGLHGGQNWRKYTGGKAPHKMSEAVWFMLHARLMLPYRELSRIHQAMEADCDTEDPKHGDPEPQ